MSKGNRGCNGNQGYKWIHPDKRKLIYQRDGHACLWCTLGFGTVVKPSLDHFIPRCMGGSNLSTNVFASCVSCNSRRAHRSALDFATQLAAEITWATTYEQRKAHLHRTLVRILSAIENPVERRLQR